MEYNLTALCLQYLTFDCFQEGLDQETLERFALRGYFAFQDYAISKWSSHFRAMVDAGPDLVTRDLNDELAVHKMAVVLDEFASNYQEDVLGEPALPGSEEACKSFTGYIFYEDLLSVWSHISRHEQRGPEARDEVSIKALGEALARNRQLLERLPSGGTGDLDTFYGLKRYKCPKLTCYYFHEGFKDAKAREKHIDRHNRPFTCTYTDCSGADFGFSSKKDLEKHVRYYHPEISDQMKSFTTATVSAKTRWICHLCEKRFARRGILNSHILSHNGERPFSCPECGKAFTRKNDCTRHEKLHAKR